MFLFIWFDIWVLNYFKWLINIKSSYWLYLNLPVASHQLIFFLFHCGCYCFVQQQNCFNTSYLVLCYILALKFFLLFHLNSSLYGPVDNARSNTDCQGIWAPTTLANCFFSATSMAFFFTSTHHFNVKWNTNASALLLEKMNEKCSALCLKHVAKLPTWKAQKLQPFQQHE